MPRALLLLPSATYRAPEMLEAARRLGVDVVTGSDRRQALAGSLPDRFLELDLDRPETAAAEIVAFARRVAIDAVVAVDDQALLTASLAAEQLGLVHNPPAAVQATRDKALMRQLLAAGGVPQPDYVVAPYGEGADADQLEAVAAAGEALGWPVVVKPCSLSGSRGVIRADDAPGARLAARQVRAILEEAGAAGGAPILVESFVPGREIAVEGLLRGGRLEVLAVFDKPDPLDGPFFEETIYVTPTRLAPAALDGATSVVAKACEAIGLTEGPVHAEVRIAGAISPTVRPVLIEVAARTIGGRCAKALRFAHGQSLEELVLAHALGRDAARGGHELGEVDPTSGAADRPARGTPAAVGASGVMMIPIPASGRLERVGGTDTARHVEHVTGLEITVPPGRMVQRLPEGDRYLGFIFARAASPAAVEAALRAAHAELAIDISPGDLVAGSRRGGGPATAARSC